MNKDDAFDARSERLQWCKDRALAYLPASTTDAITSFMSDTQKPYGDEGSLIDWSKPAYATLAQLGMLYMLQGSVTEAKRWIEGFN